MNTEYPPLLLAYIGDAVFELYVRTKIVQDNPLPIVQVHKQATSYVSADGQAKALRMLEPYLTEKEQIVVKKGRNTKGRVPKNADMSTYRRATGFEALLGWLYVRGAEDRLSELFNLLDIGGRIDEG